MEVHGPSGPLLDPGTLAAVESTQVSNLGWLLCSRCSSCGGLLGSTQTPLETTAKDLVDRWQWRRDHPGSLRQPASQWPNGRSTHSTGFNGYAPGTLELAPDMVMVHPIAERRFRSAAVDDPSRPQWATFD